MQTTNIQAFYFHLMTPMIQNSNHLMEDLKLLGNLSAA